MWTRILINYFWNLLNIHLKYLREQDVAVLNFFDTVEYTELNNVELHEAEIFCRSFTCDL